jgi:hypothetical protein
MITNVINIWFSDIEYGYPNAVLCITGNPQFVGGGDYSLQAGSPCVDAGTYYLAPKVDLATNSRPWNPTNFPDRVDMGCYEDGTGTVTNWIALGAELALEAPEADPLMDTDGDGVSNGAEMSAGTDIYNSDSYFRVYNEQVVAGGSVLISWQSTPGYAYAVQTTSSLMSPWTTVTNMTGTGAVMSFTGDMPTDSVRYYRVLVRKP